MKRYSLTIKYDPGLMSYIYPTPDTEGEWVRYDDVKAMLRRRLNTKEPDPRGLRKGAEWRKQRCETCVHAELYDAEYSDFDGQGFCWERDYCPINVRDDTACPAWQRKK